MIPICQEFEEKLIKHIWQTRAVSHRPTPSSNPSVIASPPFSPNDSEAELNEKKPVDELVKEITPPPPAHVKRHWWSWRLQPAEKGARPASDPEKGVDKRKKRKLVLIGPIYAGLGAGLSACMRLFILICHLLTHHVDFASAGISILLQEYALDHNATRFALMLTLPVIYCVSLVRKISSSLVSADRYHSSSVFSLSEISASCTPSPPFSLS